MARPTRCSLTKRLSELPGLDVTADSFVLRGPPLGRLDLKAANRGDLWRLGSSASPTRTACCRQRRLAPGARRKPDQLQARREQRRKMLARPVTRGGAARQGAGGES